MNRKVIRNTPDAPCMGCSDRAAGCHGKCERYKAWRKDLDAQREIELCERRANAYFHDETEKARKTYFERRKRRRFEKGVVK